MLRSCVAERGHRNVGWMMWTGVRVGGHPLLPFPWRWGYGRRWPSYYAEQTGASYVEEPRAAASSAPETPHWTPPDASAGAASE